MKENLLFSALEFRKFNVVSFKFEEANLILNISNHQKQTEVVKELKMSSNSGVFAWKKNRQIASTYGIESETTTTA